MNAYNWRRILLIVLSLFVLESFWAPFVSADKICLKAKVAKAGKTKVKLTRVVVDSAATCPRNHVELLDDAQDGVYGDGSAGAKTVSADETLSGTNFQFTDFIVNSGVTLTVESGTVIRCSGSFTNNGTIAVSRSSFSGSDRVVTNADTASAAGINAHPGVSKRGAGDGEAGTNSSTRDYGMGGRGLTELQARALRYPGAAASGGGGKALPGGSVAVEGGGSLVVLCRSNVVNNGLIRANGQSSTSSGGGGAGGVIILASKTAVTNLAAGQINADGGSGAPSGVSRGASGGGGGGIVHLLAPAASNLGAITVLGGSRGAAGGAGSVSAAVRSGGAGGGACGGNGGDGGSVSAAGNPGSAEAGQAGHVLLSEIDPTGTF